MIVNQLKPGNVWTVLHGGSAFFNEVTFTGSVADASSLLYMNARYYNPSTARFLSQDSYTGSASDPWTQHLYAYCNNNPVNMVDPTGHAPVGPMRKNMVCINDGSTGVWRDEMETNANGDILCGEDLVSILKNIDVRFEQTVVDDSIGLPGFFELGISSIDGHSNIYDQDGIYPIIGTTDGRLMGGVGVYSHARITALTMSAGSLSLEIGYGEVSFGITIFAKGSPFERSNMWGIGIDYTQYTGNGNYVRTTYTMEVNPLLVVAALIFISTGAPVPALAPVI